MPGIGPWFSEESDISEVLHAAKMPHSHLDARDMVLRFPIIGQQSRRFDVQLCEPETEAVRGANQKEEMQENSALSPRDAA
jgi:hypothetical protein